MENGHILSHFDKSLNNPPPNTELINVYLQCFVKTSLILMNGYSIIYLLRKIRWRMWSNSVDYLKITIFTYTNYLRLYLYIFCDLIINHFLKRIVSLFLIRNRDIFKKIQF